MAKGGVIIALRDCLLRPGRASKRAIAVSNWPASIAHDANGNFTSDGTSAYVYDAEKRLVSLSASGGTTLSYDSLGRFWKISSQQTGTTPFVYEGDHVSAGYDWSADMLRRYFWGGGGGRSQSYRMRAGS